MTLEELQIKLGIDHSGVERGMGSAYRAVEQGNKHIHDSFLHAHSPARAFHKTLHEIGQTAPGVGQALQFALSPVSGLLLGIGGAAAFLKDKIGEINAQSDALEKGLSDPITNYRDNLRSAHKALAEFQYDQQKWLRDLTANDNTIDKQLANRLALLAAKSTEIKKLGGNDADVERLRLQTTLGLQQGASRALGLQQDDLGGQLAIQSEEMARSDRQQRSQRLIQMNAKEAEIQEKLKSRIDKEQQGPGNIVSAGGAFLRGLHSVFGMGSGQELTENSSLVDLQNQLKASKERMAKNAEAIDNDTLARKALTDKINELRGKITTSHTEQQRINQEIALTTNQLSYLTGDQPQGLYAASSFDYLDYQRKSEANRMKLYQQNDLSYKLAHMNDPRSATGGPIATVETLLADIKAMMLGGNGGIFVQGGGGPG